MKVKFTKMHGAGNDFIIIDDRAEAFDLNSTSIITSISARDKGIGCEGVLIVRLAETFSGNDFRMIFFNPDGSRVGMCGNAARCVALYAYDKGIAGESQKILTDSGVIEAKILCAKPGSEIVSIRMPAPSKIIEHNIDEKKYFCINTGVPHAITIMDSTISDSDVVRIGSAVRYNATYFPEGTNVDFICDPSPDAATIKLRTYERGVEAETGACGTGATASALVLMARLGYTSPVKFLVKSGDVLEVSAEYHSETDFFSNVYLTGPARFVAQGHFESDWF